MRDDPAPGSKLLRTPLDALRGVGPERKAQLERLGLRTVEDLLLHRPRRYEDRRQVRPISKLELHEAATVRGPVVALGVNRYARGQKSVFELIIEDGTARLHCRWWNAPYMQNYFKQGDELLVHGKVAWLKPRTMDHPEIELIVGGEENSIHLNRVAPVYPLTEGLPQRWLRALIWRALEQFGKCVADPWPPALAPEFMTRAQAVQALHFPAEREDAERARQRLALDELIELQKVLQGRRRALLSKAQARPCPGDNRLIKPYLAALGFTLTRGQIEVLREIRRDMGSGQPMRRLLQGDVGSGKTVVAACSALLALESGFNVALMAPTEILAEQHFQNFRRWFEPLGIEVELRTGSQKTGQEMEPDKLDEDTNLWSAGQELGSTGSATEAKTRRVRIVIGTHALIESAWSIADLGLVVIDEQHRFGVAQRENLVRKGQYPHLLVMTATPIPRTLGLTLYGDLDISVLGELPGGRAPIRTYVRAAPSLGKVWAFVRTKLAEGRQAFVVYPRIEDTGQGLKAVKDGFAALEKELMPHRVGLLHGRLGTEEKEEVMRAFRANALQVLLSTSLIEVGIDVPNASLMVIENAEQFGLAQLHQLRGRIGRGAHESYCILVTRAKSSEAQERLKLVAETTDGFKIAEADLKMRGPGDLLGQQQSGLPPLRFAELAEDLALIERARGLAAQMLESSVESTRHL